MVRGSILPLITKKTLMLPSSIVSDSAATTLMSTDIETITAGIPEIHEIWGSYFEIGLGLYLLHSLIGDSAFAVVVPVVGTYTGVYLSAPFHHTQLLNSFQSGVNL